MPLTGALLTDVERRAFTAWLSARVEDAVRRGKSKKAIAEKLGGDSSQALNRYLTVTGSRKTARIPTPLVCVTIAAEIGASWPEALLRAGYFREVLGVIDVLANFAETRTGREKRATVELPEMIVAFALNAFPRRDIVTPEGLRFEAMFTHDDLGAFIVSDLAPKDKDDIKALTRGLDPLLASAADALGRYDMPPLTRRTIAGEFVNAWADRYDSALATRVRDRQRRVFTILKSLDKEA